MDKYFTYQIKFHEKGVDIVGAISGPFSTEEEAENYIKSYTGPKLGHWVIVRKFGNSGGDCELVKFWEIEE